jgi:hypothetical protein
MLSCLAQMKRDCFLLPPYLLMTFFTMPIIKGGPVPGYRVTLILLLLISWYIFAQTRKSANSA